MLKIADNNVEDDPNAAKILRNDRYMDDLIRSFPTPGKAVQSIKELDKVLTTGCFKIKEWLSSSNCSKAENNKLMQESMTNSGQRNLNVKSDLAAVVSMNGEKGVKT